MKLSEPYHVIDTSPPGRYAVMGSKGKWWLVDKQRKSARKIGTVMAKRQNYFDVAMTMAKEKNGIHDPDSCW